MFETVWKRWKSLKGFEIFGKVLKLVGIYWNILISVFKKCYVLQTDFDLFWNMLKYCLGFAHSVEASWRLGGSEAWRLGAGSSWEIDEASWRLPGGSWDEGNVKFMCKSFQNPSSKSGSFRETPGRKAMSRLCVNPFKILHQSCLLLPGASGRLLEGNVKIRCKSF